MVITCQRNAHPISLHAALALTTGSGSGSIGLRRTSIGSVSSDTAVGGDSHACDEADEGKEGVEEFRLDVEDHAGTTFDFEEAFSFVA